LKARLIQAIIGTPFFIFPILSKEGQTMSQLANAIRFLSVDAVQKANSGHPGAPMGMAEMAEVLWTKFLNHNPAKIFIKTLQPLSYHPIHRLSR